MSNTPTPTDNDFTPLAAQIEQGMAILAAHLAERSKETFARVQHEVNVNGKAVWTCYTPAVGHTGGATFADAIAGQFAVAERAEKLRKEAADLLARADKLEGAAR